MRLINSKPIKKQAYWRKLLDASVLLAITSLFLYLALWTGNYSQLIKATETSKASIDILKQINVSIELTTDIKPQLFIKELEHDTNLLSTLNSNLETMLLREQTAILANYAVNKQSYQELLSTQERLKLKQSIISITDVSESEFQGLNKARLLELYSINSDLQLAIKDAKETINSVINEKRSKNEFNNPLWSYTSSDIKKLIAEMSASEKAGQLLMFSLSGTSLTKEDAKKINDLNLGGAILMGYNISNPNQLKSFSSQIQQANTKFPALIATDQEGGVVKRVSWDDTAGAKSWSSMDTLAICNLSNKRALTLASSGINLNLAPVVDLTYNGNGFINNRTISGDPEVVTKQATEFVRCSQAAGVATALKHYPGHGSTAADSHIDLPQITKTKADWLKSDALPFSTIKESKFIMVGHLLMSDIDKEHPASLSKIMLNDVLRNELKYQGLIITDDMHQLQVSTKMNYKLAIADALNAGVDVLLYVGLPASKNDIHAEVTRLISSNELPAQEVDAKLLRILSFKSSLY